MCGGRVKRKWTGMGTGTFFGIYFDHSSHSSYLPFSFFVLLFVSPNNSSLLFLSYPSPPHLTFSSSPSLLLLTFPSPPHLLFPFFSSPLPLLSFSSHLPSHSSSLALFPFSSYSALLLLLTFHPILVFPSSSPPILLLFLSFPSPPTLLCFFLH